MSSKIAQSYAGALAGAMRSGMERHAKTIVLGQGVADHKGTFGTTAGLLATFGPDRVIDTPLMEEGMTGIAVGAALNGLYPIQTHIRSDFALLAMNQIINLAAKYRYMFGGRFTTPMLIRLIVGRSWGQGAQHSQSLQSLFAHIPGLTVIMPSHPQIVLEDYAHAIDEHPGPVISLEHRLMYPLRFKLDEAPRRPAPMTAWRVRSGDDVTIAATSIMALEAQRAADHLAATHGVGCDVIDLNCVSSIDRDMLMQSVRRTGKLIVADTSWLAFGVAAEVARIVAESDPGALTAPMVSLGMAPAPCPTAKTLEDLYYPNLASLTEAVARLVAGKRDHGMTLPDESSMADVYKRFKGPF